MADRVPRGRTASRVAVLWMHLTGYTQAALNATLAADDASLFVIETTGHDNAEFQPFTHPRCELIQRRGGAGNDAEALRRLAAFAPDIAIITAGKDPVYRRAAEQLHAAGTIVVWASDLPSGDYIRDIYAAIRGRMGIVRAYDAALVAGKRAADYAERSGFAAQNIFMGLYGCDTALFRPYGVNRHGSDAAADWPQQFLFVGQFIERKGIDVLVDAYRQYRASTPAPWSLCCAGAGPLRSMLDNEPGIDVRGFLPPAECAALMGQSGALILPSRVDHWGVVIHEAACAGLPVIASRTSFASADLIDHGQSGFVFDAQNASALAKFMAECAVDGRARLMGRQSLAASYRFGPDRFADAVLNRIPSAFGFVPQTIAARS